MNLLYCVKFIGVKTQRRGCYLVYGAYENNKIFAVTDSSLYIEQINPVFFNDKTVIVKGLKDGTKIISKPLPGAFEGMKVKINNGRKAK